MSKSFEHVTPQPLDDPKAEKLAYGVGYHGTDYASAAAAAGIAYKNRQSAQAGVGLRLRNITFAGRVAYWRRRREEDEADRLAITQERAVVDEAFVIDGLKEIHKQAMGVGNLSVARQALVDLGKTLGMFIDKTVNQNQNIDLMSDEQLMAEVEQELGDHKDDDGTVH
jgi:hypothetical protein